jgi:hypothetical protein
MSDLGIVPSRRPWESLEMVVCVYAHGEAKSRLLVLFDEHDGRASGVVSRAIYENGRNIL